MDKVISIKTLSGGYENHKIFDNLTLNVNKGTFTAVIGPNGSGKSTLLKYLIKELKTEDKKIFINSEDINLFNSIELAKNISFVGQTNKTEYEFTVKEFVQMGRYCHQDENSNTEAVENAIKQVGLVNLENKLITQISGGERQLTLVARAICQDADIMVLDEPINNLDPKHVIELMSLLKRLSQSGKTIICVLHDLNAVLNYCDNCIMMKDGTAVSIGKTKQILNPENVKNVYGINSKVISLSRGRKLLTFYDNQ